MIRYVPFEIVQVYNKRNAVVDVVPFKVRKDGYAVCHPRARNRYRKSWLLKNVVFTLATDPPTPAPTHRAVSDSESADLHL